MSLSEKISEEKDILNISHDKFKWKTTGQLDKIENLLADKFVFIHITGYKNSKSEWMEQLKRGGFVYEKIDNIEESVNVFENTAVLIGKAKFTINGGCIFNLVYTEVYIKKNNEWELLIIQTTSSY